MVEAVSTAAAGFTAGAASGAELDSAAGAGFVAARSAEERHFTEGQDFTVERSAAASTATATAAAGAGADAVGVGEAAGVGEDGAGASAGAGRIGVGPDTGMGTDTGIRTDMGMGTTRITRPAMVPTTILTTTLRPLPLILRLPARIEIIHTRTTATGMLHRRARRPDPPTTSPTTGTTPHRGMPGRRRRIPTVPRARMA